MRIDNGYRPHRFQKEIHDNLKRFSVLVCHRRFGKTFLAVNLLVRAAITTRKEEARFVYVAPFLKQAKDIAWGYLKRFGMVIPGCKANESELSIRFPNQAQVRLYGSDNGESMRGIYVDGGVGDEVGDWRLETWPEIIRPALSDRKGWFLFIGTPKGLGQFHDLYQHAQADPEWYAGLFRADETGLIDSGELEAAKKIMSANQYRQEFLCDFSAASDDVLIPIDLVVEASSRGYRPASQEGLPKILGVDVARFGDDRSVILRRHGQVVFEPTVLTKIDNMALAGRVANEIERFHPDAVFVDGGRGEGVIDRLRQLGHGPVEVSFGGAPNNPRYANKRSEMWDSMRQWIEEGGSLPANKELQADLCVPRYGFSAANKLILESKEKIKERGGRSPDLADALALTFAYPVAPRSREFEGGTQVHSDYDPFR